MSNGLGFFTIQFFTGNGTKDADAAKRIYDWCMEKYDWFCGESGDGSDAPFLLENNAFVANENVFPDGIEIKHNPALPDDLDWPPAIPYAGDFFACYHSNLFKNT